MELILEQLAVYNVSDIVEHGMESYSSYYPLPRTDEEGRRHLAFIDRFRRTHVMDEYVAYDTEGGKRNIVGGGQIMNEDNRFLLGFWVVASMRRKGYGTAIARQLETLATTEYPFEDHIEAHIDEQNAGSRAIVMKLGYMLTEQVDEEGFLIYQKRLRQ